MWQHIRKRTEQTNTGRSNSIHQHIDANPTIIQQFIIHSLLIFLLFNERLLSIFVSSVCLSCVFLCPRAHFFEIFSRIFRRTPDLVCTKQQIQFLNHLPVNVFDMIIKNDLRFLKSQLAEQREREKNPVVRKIVDTVYVCELLLNTTLL